MKIRKSDRFVLIKPALDAHTMGLMTTAELLTACGYPVEIAPPEIARAIDESANEQRQLEIASWIASVRGVHIGISYRLDPDDAARLVGTLLEILRKNRLFHDQGGFVRSLFFAGLPDACERVKREWSGRIETFQGGETAVETLSRLGVPESEIPTDILEGSQYDNALLSFAQELIQKGTASPPPKRSTYPTYGTTNDTIEARLNANNAIGGPPLLRAHVGPYHPELSRRENVQEFLNWAKTLAASSHLDILSVGSSQLSQSHFGENWGDRPNGGGVPLNTEDEFRQVREACVPMLVRTYSATKNVPQMAEMYERALNICWHALSFWWFNTLDGRGPYDLLEGLRQHFQTLDVIAAHRRAFEANVPHHFAFRGADDVTYLVSAYLAAKAAKTYGIHTYILQNMLNTPRLTWGIQDLAKSRALLQLVRPLIGPDFRIVLQPRAGLDYFKPDLDAARIQLAGNRING